jgi:hypothetical protein
MRKRKKAYHPYILVIHLEECFVERCPYESLVPKQYPQSSSLCDCLAWNLKTCVYTT